MNTQNKKLTLQEKETILGDHLKINADTLRVYDEKLGIFLAPSFQLYSVSDHGTIKLKKY